MHISECGPGSMLTFVSATLQQQLDHLVSTIPASTPSFETLKMAKIPVIVLALLALAWVAAAQNMASCPAKYRYQWFYVMNDPSPANLKALDALVMKNMRDDCTKVLTYGQGPALSTKPATYGIAAASPTVEFADYGAWSDWASLDDLKSCIEKGTASGALAQIRKFSKKASRVVYELMDCPPASNSPATIRYMFNYMLKDFSPATCTKAKELQGTITSSLGAMRHSNGCDAFGNSAKAYGATIPVTANYGGFIDFKNEKDMTDYLSSKDAKAAPARAEIRDLATSSIRGAVALPATSYRGGEAKVAKERGYMP